MQTETTSQFNQRPRMSYVTEARDSIIQRLAKIYKHVKVETLGWENGLWVSDTSLEKAIGDIYPTYTEFLGTRSFASFAANIENNFYDAVHGFYFGGIKFRGKERYHPDISVMDAANEFVKAIDATKVSHIDEDGNTFDPSNPNFFGRERVYHQSTVWKKYDGITDLNSVADEFLRHIQLYRKQRLLKTE